MTKNLLAEMHKILLEEKTKLEKELSQFTHHNPQTSADYFEANAPVTSDEEGENASEVAQYSDNLSLEDALEKASRDVESALKRFEEGTYGICIYCKQPIDERRLRARPTSSSCIQCKKTMTQEV